MNITNNPFPKTRYQGSKLKIIDWVYSHLSEIPHTTFLDAFSGTSSVSHIMKKHGSIVISNDIMPCNYWVAKALIENQSVTLTQNETQALMLKRPNKKYQSFIQDNFYDIYYTNDENMWLDVVVQNIYDLNDEYKKSIAFWALFQSCIIKRPYNLFHRKNLHIRMADVPRSFGNKSTWDKPFEHFFTKFVAEANNAVFKGTKGCIARNDDVLKLELSKPDLVYLDPPYIPEKGTLTTYQDFYHFLNGLSDYYNWHKNIDYKSKHLKLLSDYSIWEDRQNIINGFDNIVKNFKNSIIVISYRNDGIPSIQELVLLLEKHGKTVSSHSLDHQYVLSKKKGQELLIIGK